MRQNYKQSFADVEVQLKQRYNLIPNLIETVKGYVSHEKEVLTEVTKARAEAMNVKDISSKSDAESSLTAAVGNLLAVAENYPNLKANQNFIKLQEELSDIENKISSARRFFNNAVSEYNTSIEQFPAILFASMFGFKKQDFFEIENQEEKKNIKVDF